MTGKPTVAVAPVSTHAPLGALDALRVDAAPVDFDAFRDGDARGDVGTVSTSTRVSRGADDARADDACSDARLRRRFAGHPNVPHVRQTRNWDCGLACALMVLKALVVQADADPSEAGARLSRSHGARRADLPTLRRRCATRSVWTIDLAHLLRSFHPLCDVAFYTVTLGANPAFREERFYRDSIEDDASRVARLFAGAADAGILVEKRSVCLRNVKRWAASAEWILIVLVDKRALAFSPARDETRADGVETRRDAREDGARSKKTKPDQGNQSGVGSTDASASAAILDRVFGARPEAEARRRARRERERESDCSARVAPDASRSCDGYTGHYVVVCGYDAVTDCFRVRDPAVAVGRPPTDWTDGRFGGGGDDGDDGDDDGDGSVVPARALETARRAFGTDEDLLLVRRRRER